MIIIIISVHPPHLSFKQQETDSLTYPAFRVFIFQLGCMGRWRLLLKAASIKVPGFIGLKRPCRLIVNFLTYFFLSGQSGSSPSDSRHMYLMQFAPSISVADFLTVRQWRSRESARSFFIIWLYWLGRCCVRIVKSSESLVGRGRRQKQSDKKKIIIIIIIISVVHSRSIRI